MKLTQLSTTLNHYFQEYPKFEVVVINDGSTDETLEILINKFSLIQVDFFTRKIITQKIRGHYKSTNSIF
jgi:glycosyltransferase involved in cell wall biosynthesis